MIMDNQKKEKFIYDLDVLRALVDIEISRISRYGKEGAFSIAFIYSPTVSTLENDETALASMIKNNLRSSDVLSAVEKDFAFVFLPETDERGTKEFLRRMKEKLPSDTITGYVTYPEDGTNSFDIFQKLMKDMQTKLLLSEE